MEKVLVRQIIIIAGGEGGRKTEQKQDNRWICGAFIRVYMMMYTNQMRKFKRKKHGQCRKSRID